MVATALGMLVCSSAFGAYFPSTHDTDGWGLRIHRLSVPGPFIEETIEHIKFDVSLFNFSTEAREHPPLFIALRTNDLHMYYARDDKPIPVIGGAGNDPPPFTQAIRLPPGHFSSLDVMFGTFRYTHAGAPGRYRMQAMMRLGAKVITSPPVWIEVVAVPKDAILAQIVVPVTEEEARLRPASRTRHVVQQVKIADRTYLFYGRRIAELPGKCEMNVEGVYGNWGPLTITYKKPPDGATVKLVVHSVDGSPWEVSPIRPDDMSLPPPRVVKKP